MSGSPIAAPSVPLAGSNVSRSLPLRWLQTAQHLSLDIVVGVAGAAVFAVTMTGATMPMSWWVLLPLATWTIYSADHLLDALKTGADAQQPRHRFYHQRFGVLAAITVLFLIAGSLAAALWLPRSLLLPGLVAGAAAAVHLASAGRVRRIVAKEFSVAAIYIGGIWFGPLLYAPRWDRWLLACIGLHLLAALLNLIVFALFEERHDRLDGHASIVRSWGRSRVERWVALLTTVGVVGVLLAVATDPTPRPIASLVLLALVLTPWALLWKCEIFGINQRYRAVGDLAFLLLLLPVLFAS